MLRLEARRPEVEPSAVMAESVEPGLLAASGELAAERGGAAAVAEEKLAREAVLARLDPDCRGTSCWGICFMNSLNCFSRAWANLVTSFRNNNNDKNELK